LTGAESEYVGHTTWRGGRRPLHSRADERVARRTATECHVRDEMLTTDTHTYVHSFLNSNHNSEGDESSELS